MAELREDVESQCKQYGTMTGIAIDEDQCLVLVRYSTEEEAMNCMKGLDGRSFDGRKLSMELAKEEGKKSEEDELLNDFFASIAEEEAKFAKKDYSVCLNAYQHGIWRKEPNGGNRETGPKIHFL